MEIAIAAPGVKVSPKSGENEEKEAPPKASNEKDGTSGQVLETQGRVPGPSAVPNVETTNDSRSEIIAKAAEKVARSQIQTVLQSANAEVVATPLSVVACVHSHSSAFRIYVCGVLL